YLCKLQLQFVYYYRFIIVFFFFFFSSRRRHTRFSRDWSSDVCSSDLIASHWSLLAGQFSKNRSLSAYPLLVGLEFPAGEFVPPRSEERRVGKECRSRWGPEL